LSRLNVAAVGLDQNFLTSLSASASTKAAAVVGVMTPLNRTELRILWARSSKPVRGDHWLRRPFPHRAAVLYHVGLDTNFWYGKAA